MKIVYNPQDGATIKNYIFGGIVRDPHYPDKYEYIDTSGRPQVANGLMQYEDDCADAIIEHFGFLKPLTQDEAEKIVARPKDERFKCDHPNCDFSTYTKIALYGHKRTHTTQATKDGTPIFDPTVVPVSGGQHFVTPDEKKRAEKQAMYEETQNGTDGDGVEWYGEGVKVENFGPIRNVGQGHFIG